MSGKPNANVLCEATNMPAITSLQDRPIAGIEKILNKVSVQSGQKRK
jgi:hypothetical protein